MTSRSVSGSYDAPNGKKEFAHEISSSASDSQSAATEYLGSLRKKVLQLQGEVNAFLTQKMDEDKATANNTGGVGNGHDEQKAEDNYGEEVEEDD